MNCCANCGSYGGMICGMASTDGSSSKSWLRCYRCSADTLGDGTLMELAPIGWGQCCCTDGDATMCSYHKSYG